MRHFLSCFHSVKIFTVLLILSGCQTSPHIQQLSSAGLDNSNREQLPTPYSHKITPSSITEFPLIDDSYAKELRFHTDDIIRVSIWGYPELDHTTAVQPNGYITLPLAGEVWAENQTINDLRAAIAEKLQPFSETSKTSLRTGDALYMQVWQQPELSISSTIQPNGDITLPLVGNIHTRNKSITEIQKEVVQKLRQHLRDVKVTVIPEFHNRRMLIDHQVSVLAIKLAPRQAAIIGAVRAQGLIQIKGSLRVLDALAKSQVNHLTANLNSVVIIRNPEGKSPSYRQLRLDDYMKGSAPDQNIFLQNGDIVIVPKTLISKVGDYVERFFIRTQPIFNWWLAFHQASVAPEATETVELINQALRNDLLNISP